MHITVLAVGKVREAFLAQGIDEYLKRLRRFAAVQVVEVGEEQAPESLSPAEREAVRAAETDRLLRQVKASAYVVALVIEGVQCTSEAFAARLQALNVHGQSEVTFLIGGSLGLAPAAHRRADLALSFGRFTYPHQLVRLLLLEQVYRACKIMRGEPYHK